MIEKCHKMAATGGMDVHTNARMATTGGVDDRKCPKWVAQGEWIIIKMLKSVSGASGDRKMQKNGCHRANG